MEQSFYNEFQRVSGFFADPLYLLAELILDGVVMSCYN